MGAIARLRDGFTGAVAATALFATPTCAAQDDSRTAAAPAATAAAANVSGGNVTPSNDATETVSYCIQPEGYPLHSCATQGYETERTLDQILADPELDNVVVLHFGEGLLDAGILASALEVGDNIPAVAIPGGPEGHVQLIIAGYTTDRMIFDQDRVDMGRVGGVAIVGYPRVMARKEEARREASLNSDATVMAGYTPGGRD